MKFWLLLAVLTFGANTIEANADASHQWALRYLAAQNIWKQTTGSNVTVAIIDSGVTPTENLGSRLLTGADFSTGTGESVGNGQIDDGEDGHGSGMASIVAGSGEKQGETQGLAPSAKILPLRTFAISPAAIALGLAPAVNYATSHDSRVISVSMVVPADEMNIKHAVADAIAHDTVVVAAVGNGGDSQQYYPAAYSGVLGVGAIDSDGKVWSQSNTGADVGLVAPGVNIYRDDNRGRQGYSDGTSEATAYVSAAAALVRSAHPTWTAPEVVAALIDTADKPAAMHGAVRTDQYGYGILNVLAALKLKAPPPPVGGSGSPDPVMASGDFGVAARERTSGGGAGVVFGVAGGVLAAAGAGVVALVVVRRRGSVGRRG